MDLRYPIGRFEWTGPSTAEDRQRWIEQIGSLPSELLSAAGGLTHEQLDTPYRDGGWTVRQVIHHVADSHMHSYLRCKLALVEDDPTIKAYDEKVWAQLPDSVTAPCEISLSLLDSLHRRWVVVWKNIADDEWSRSYRHPEHGLVSLDMTLAHYAWHGRHHTAHITGLRQRMNWT
jgi:uncharacterized damage-inducible protein DinB